MSEVQFEGNKKFREVTIHIAIYDKGWSYHMVNRGHEHLVYEVGEGGRGDPQPRRRLR